MVGVVVSVGGLGVAVSNGAIVVVGSRDIVGVVVSVSAAGVRSWVVAVASGAISTAGVQANKMDNTKAMVVRVFRMFISHQGNFS